MAATARSCPRSGPAPDATSRANSKYIFGPSGVAARPDQAAAGLRRGLYRLVTAGIRYRRRPVRRRGHAGGLSLRRPLSRIRQASRRRPGGRHQEQRTSLQRELFKQCVLAVQYGMEAEALALRIGQPPVVARDLLRAHRETYPQFWRWSDAAVDQAMLHGASAHGFWLAAACRRAAQPAIAAQFPDAGQRRRDAAHRLLLGDRARDRGVRPGARRGPDRGAAGADRSRRRGHARGHGGSLGGVLGGFVLGTEAKTYPDRYRDPRGEVMWKRVSDLVRQRERRTA